MRFLLPPKRSAKADPAWYRPPVVELEPVFDASELPEPPQPAVEKITGIPLIGQGIRIEHTRDDVSGRVIFYSMRSPQRLLDAIARSAFEPSGDPDDQPTSRKWPLRLPFVVTAIVLWNGLFLLDRPWARTGEDEFIWGPGTFTAIGLAFLGTQLIRTWAPLQRFALAGPWALARIEGPRRLLAFVSGSMFVMGGIAALATKT